MYFSIFKVADTDGFTRTAYKCSAKLVISRDKNINPTKSHGF